MGLLDFWRWVTRIEENRGAMVAHAPQERNKLATEDAELLLEWGGADRKGLKVVVAAEGDFGRSGYQAPICFVGDGQDRASKAEQVGGELGIGKALTGPLAGGDKFREPAALFAYADVLGGGSD